MIDPYSITRFGQTQEELEEALVFWIMVAGKKASTIAKRLDALQETLGRPKSLFAALAMAENLPALLREHGFGCYNQKAPALRALYGLRLNLATCSLEQLEAIPYVGRKTSRCFLLHSRPNQPYAGLDIHVLRWMRRQGYTGVPGTTPTDPRRYAQVEQIFLKLAKEKNKTPAELDLAIWRLGEAKPKSKSKATKKPRLRGAA